MVVVFDLRVEVVGLTEEDLEEEREEEEREEDLTKVLVATTAAARRIVFTLAAIELISVDGAATLF